jgi:hypothetical protein
MLGYQFITYNGSLSLFAGLTSQGQQASKLRKIGAQLLWNISLLAMSSFDEGHLQRTVLSTFPLMKVVNCLNS